MSRYLSKTKEYAKEYMRKWRKKTGNKWWQKNKESHRANSNKWRKAHSEYMKEWKRKNKEWVKEKQREYYYAKPNKRLLNQRDRSLRKQGGLLTVETIKRVYKDNIKKYGVLTCIYCLKSIQLRQDSLEHKYPLSKGGTNEYDNLAIAHRSCNCRKNNKTEEEFRNGKDLL